MDIVHRGRPQVLMLLACLALAGPVAAQAPQTSGAPPLTGAQLALLDARASELIGQAVKNPQGEELGHIADLILDVENAHVRYAIVSYGGALGFGTRLAAFPPVLFRPGPKEGELLLNVTRTQFEQAPSFESDAWPNWLDERYSEQVDRFFLQGDELVRRPSGARLTRASDVIGKSVNDGGSRRAGSIEDVVVNLGNGQIRYVVLNYGSRLGFNKRLVPLPVSAFRFPTRPDLNIFLLLDRDRVAKARAFDEDNWPDLNDARQRREMDAWLSQFPQQDKRGQQQPATGGPTSPAGSGAAGEH